LKRSPTARTANRRLIFLCGIVPAAFAAVLALYRPAFLATLDNAVYDILMRWAGAKPPGGRVIIVDVDERSLAAIGQWPWRRDLIGRLVARLREMGTSTIALDIIFAEPDRDNRPGDPQSRSNASTQDTPDGLLAETLRPGGVVLGYAMTFDAAARAPSPCALHPLGLAIIEPRE
jgi:adenylate cyclase